MMQIDLLPYTIAWAVLGVVVLVLAILRRKMVEGEDDTIKLGEGEVAEISKQTELATKLSKVELWGKWLTVVLVVTGLILAVCWGLQQWSAVR
jgi:hypothetical protein